MQFCVDFATNIPLFISLLKVLRLRVLPKSLSCEIFYTYSKTRFLFWCLNTATVAQDPISTRGKVSPSVGVAQLPLLAVCDFLNLDFSLLSLFLH